VAAAADLVARAGGGASEAFFMSARAAGFKSAPQNGQR
jgi:hypothetical protein